ncbi:MAG: hypothetical protein ACXVP5_12750, partial [Tumebacillaceae bacterium]
MSATQKSYLWKSMLFAVLVDAVFLLVTCLLFGLPHASLTTTMTPKAPITVGFSSVVELLNLSALFDAGPLMILLLGLCVTFLYPLLNACYISLLARSVRDFW